MKILKVPVLCTLGAIERILYTSTAAGPISKQKPDFGSRSGSNRSENDSPRSGVSLGTLRNRWGHPGDILGRPRLEIHENIESTGPLNLRDIRAYTSREYSLPDQFQSKNQILEA